MWPWSNKVPTHEKIIAHHDDGHKKVAGSVCEYGSSRSCFKNQVIITRIHTNHSKEAVIRYMHDCKKHTTQIYNVDWYRDALGNPGGYLGLPGSFWCPAVKSHASDHKHMLLLRIKRLSCFIRSRRFGWCKLSVIPTPTIVNKLNGFQWRHAFNSSA